MASRLLLIRGLPGSGKTHLANALSNNDIDPKGFMAQQPNFSHIENYTPTPHDVSPKIPIALSQSFYTARTIAADDYFGHDDDYDFRPDELQQAHKQCLKTTENRLLSRRPCIVHNTFSQQWEIKPYIDLYEKLKTLDESETNEGSFRNPKMWIIDLYDNGYSDEELFERNIHGVPLETIAKMRERWEK